MRIVLAFYQLIYGALGFLYSFYFLIESFFHSELLRIFLITPLLIFNIYVIYTGFKAMNSQQGWKMNALVSQILQICPLSIFSIYLSLRCGISYNFFIDSKNFQINLLDLNSELSWGQTHLNGFSINLFAIAVSIFIISSIIRERNKIVA